ncbi:hypothetical protein [Clostridium sp.]|uniref:hypothetical protein n=1 Tax=Clostridium sp. TaxID=1506 RepID=UPI001A3788DF|nr:hypothetical protein [Clostridium sp.]MBK5242198.1 hypothetical protein [Clostridium sp.]
MSVKFAREFYGLDSFSKTTLIGGIVLFLTGDLWILGAALIVYSIWRSKSTNVYKRNNERYIFESIKRKFNHKVKELKQVMERYLKQNNNKIKSYNPMDKLREKRKYIITTCPKCSQKLRIPRSKGKIIVTCSKCGSEFRLKT